VTESCWFRALAARRPHWPEPITIMSRGGQQNAAHHALGSNRAKSCSRPAAPNAMRGPKPVDFGMARSKPVTVPAVVVDHLAADSPAEME
jgi:hypothetical protein